ncbi:hypothetical protein ACGF5F_31530 [Streptomyces sp. NPDC047821]|uniref:hypothetical protein n=1 Tax=unclassified Streptomyces TaxID=2593676 RepID=UPI0036371CF7
MPASSVPDGADTPATALGPTALVLGALSAICAWVPSLVIATLPWATLAGALAVTLGASGIYCARRGVGGRLGIAVAGTVLGAMGLTGAVALFWALSA